MAKNQAKIQFTADCKEFNAQIQKANSTMQELRAELRNNEAQMKANGASVGALEDKYKILSNQFDASKDKVQALEGKLEAAIRNFGEGSIEVDKWRTQLINAQTAQEKVKQAMDGCNAEIKEQKRALKEAESATKKLADTIGKQQTELSHLKNDYANAVLQYGKTSTEAKNLAKQIDKLSNDLKENQKKMNAAENAANDLDNSLRNAGNGAEEASEGFTVLKGAMADLVADGIEKVATGLGEIGTEAFVMANDIDKASNTFIARTGESVGSAEGFEDVMTSIYQNNFGESFEDIADAMATVRTNMGEMDDGTLQSMTEGAILLRDTFDFDINETTRTAAMLMDQFGMSGTDAYNLIAQGAQNGLNKNGDLLDTINEYSVQFKDAGYSAEDMFNMLVNGTNEGTWSVDKLGDAVKEFNIRASDGTVGDAIKENAKAFGFTKQEAEALASEVESGSVGAYEKLREKLAQVDDDTQRYQLGVEMFGTMWEDLGEEAVFALLDTQGEISTTSDALEQINNVKYDDLGSAIEGIKRNLQTSVAEPIKNEVMPAVNEFVEDVDWQGVGQTIGEVMGVAVDAFFSLVEGIKATVQWMNEHKAVCAVVATAIGIVATAIGAYNIVQGVKAAMDAANVTTVWALVAAHIAQAAAAMAAIAPYIVAVAIIAAVVAAIVWLIKNWDMVSECIANVWEKVKATLSQWGEWINTNVVEPVKQFFVGLWDNITNACSSAWEWVKGIFASFVSWVNTNVIQPIVNFFTGLWQSLQTIWNTICNVIQVAIMFIGSIISAAVQIIAIPFRLIWETCKTIVTAVWNWIKPYIANAINAVKDTISNVMNTIKTVFSTIWNAIKNVVTTVWNAVKSVVTSAVNAVKSKVTTVFNAVKNTVTNIFNAVKSKVTTVWNSIKSVITNVVNNIKSKITAVWNAIKSVITSVLNAVKSVVTSAWNAVKTTVTNAMNNVKSVMTNAWNTVKNTVSNAINNVKSSISNGLNSAKNTVSNVLNSIKSKFTSIWNTCKSTVSNAIQKIKNMMNFEWSLPKLKLPHFSISGKFSLNPPSVPKFSVEWYKLGAIFTKPTLFSTPYGMKGVGEAGPEAVLPIDKLEGYIANAIERTQTAVNFDSLAAAIEDLANRPVALNINGRQFALATAGDSDGVSGLRSTFKNRGLALD